MSTVKYAYLRTASNIRVAASLRSHEDTMPMARSDTCEIPPAIDSGGANLSKFFAC